MSSSSQKNKKTTTYSVNGGSCYAVAQGRQCGIFFSWDQAHAQIQHTADGICKAFRSEAEARKFLEETHQLVPSQTDSGGWLTTDGAPVLYERSKANKRPAASASFEVIDISSSTSGSQNENADDDDDDDSEILQVFPPASGLSRTTTTKKQKTASESSPEAPAPAEPPKLDKIQQDAIDAAMEGKNIFLTGYVTVYLRSYFLTELRRRNGKTSFFQML